MAINKATGSWNGGGTFCTEGVSCMVARIQSRVEGPQEVEHTEDEEDEECVDVKDSKGRCFTFSHFILLPGNAMEGGIERDVSHIRLHWHGQDLPFIFFSFGQLLTALIQLC